MPRPILWADDPVLKVALTIKRSEFISPPPKGYLGWDEERLVKCAHCNHHWAAPHSEYCPICEVL